MQVRGPDYYVYAPDPGLFASYPEYHSLHGNEFIRLVTRCWSELDANPWFLTG